MRCPRLAILAVLFLANAWPLHAQGLSDRGASKAAVPAPAAQTASSSPDASSLAGFAGEWMVAVGPAVGVQLFHSVGGHRYLLQTVSWGRVLTEATGPGPLRGRFAWAVEGVPVFGQFEPTNAYGIGLSPIVWRWNFEPRDRVAPFAELAGGLLWTNQSVPDGTTTVNFTAHLGGGVRYFIRPGRAVVLGYRFHHISNGNRLQRNPGVNAHAIMIGVSFVRPGR
jgi:hypothetical protein